eukprot:3937145-Pyramimonas_sp.AAC.1
MFPRSRHSSCPSLFASPCTSAPPSLCGTPPFPLCPGPHSTPAPPGPHADYLFQSSSTSDW